ncbi:MAG: PAS domain-containing protein [bacterium]|nr:PAS domain-containing protein [bacterium]
MMKIACVPILIFLLTAAAFGAEPPEPFVIYSCAQTYAVGKKLEFIEDPGKSLKIDAVSTGTCDWKPVKKDFINFGYTKSAYWFRLSIENKSGEELYFEIDFPLLDYIEFYTQNEQGDFEEIKTGDRREFSSRQLSHRNFVFKLKDRPGIQKIYFRIRSTSRLHFTPAVMDLHEMYKTQIDELPYYWLFYGIMLIMMLYNFIIFLSVREAGYLYLVVMIFSWLMYQLVIDGVAFMYMWPDSPEWANKATLIFPALIIVSMGLFIQSYLKTRVGFPRVNKFLLSYMIPGAFLVILILVKGYLVMFPLIILGMYMNLGNTIVVAYAAVKRSRFALFLLGAFGVYFLSITIYLLILLDIIILPVAGYTIVKIGSCSMAFLLSVSVAHKLNLVRKYLQENETIINKTNEELVGANSTLAEAQRIARLGNWRWNIYDNTVYWSHEIFNLIGSSREKFEASYNSFLDMVHPADLAEVKKAFYEALHENKDYSIVHRIILPNGRERIVHEQGEVRRDESGNPVTMTGTVQDITDLKETEMAYKAEQDKLTILIDGLSLLDIGVEIVGDDYKVQYQNRVLREKFGDMTGRLCHGQYTCIEKPCDRCPIAAAFTSKSIGRAEVPGIDGRYYEILAAPLPDPDGSIKKAVEVVRDITDRKLADEKIHHLNKELEERVEERTAELRQSINDLQQTQKQLVQSEKMAALGGLVAGVAHEINTPLGIGVTAASFLVDKMETVSELQAAGQLKRSELEKCMAETGKASATILTNLQRAAELVRNFKQVAVDQTTEKRRIFNVKDYIEEILHSLYQYLDDSKHTISIQCPDDLEIVSYPGAYFQIITNLVTNSIFHGFKGGDDGKITFDISLIDETINFRYYDNGCGMKEEELEKIFDPFYTTNRKGGLTGLGMHILYNLVTQRLKGIVECAGSPGNGVFFTMLLPASP